MIDVALTSQEHDDRQIVTDLILDFPFHASGPVGGNQVAADGVGVVGNVGDEQDQTSVLLDCQHRNFRINAAFRLDNIWIEFARIGQHGAVLHPEPAVERQRGAFRASGQQFGFRQTVIRLAHSLCRFRHHFRQVFLIHGSVEQRSCVRSGVRVGCAEQQIFRKIHAGFLHSTDEAFRQFAVEQTQIVGDNADDCAAAFKEGGFDGQRIVCTLVRTRFEITAERNSPFGGDVFFGKSETDHSSTSTSSPLFCADLWDASQSSRLWRPSQPQRCLPLRTEAA